MSTATIATLADCRLEFVRCINCIEELPQSALAESHTSLAAQWFVVQCPKCRCWSPFQRKEATRS